MGAAALAALVIGVAVGPGCYNPSIEDGALACSADFKCPTNFACGPDGKCRRPGAPIGGAGGVGGTSGIDGGAGVGGGGMGGGGMGGVDGMCPAPYGPFPSCMAMSRGSCDPVCQAGCKCNERCNLDPQGVAQCGKQAPPFAGPNDRCDPKADTCRPGLICLSESNPAACQAHCYRFCRADGDCLGNAKCTTEIILGDMATGNKVCSPPPEGCNPWGPAACTNRAANPSPTFACYVLSARFSDIAVCDCAGTKKLNETCDFEHECEPGHECVKLGTQALCRRVCSLAATGGVLMGGCPVGQVCTAFPSSTKYGYCR